MLGIAHISTAERSCLEIYPQSHDMYRVAEVTPTDRDLNCETGTERLKVVYIKPGIEGSLSSGKNPADCPSEHAPSDKSHELGRRAFARTRCSSGTPLRGGQLCSPGKTVMRGDT